MKHFRWYIAVLLLMIMIVNYLDRQTLAVTAPVIKAEFAMSNTSYANVLNAFWTPYIISGILAGAFIDRIGPKIGLTLYVAFWSVACMLHAFARSVFGFGFYRALLGVGEGGNFPAAVRVVSEWFPPHEKSFAVGLFNSGSCVGAVIAPPLIGYLTLKYGWRSAYVAVAGVGLLALAGWLFFYEKPEKNKWLTEQEREFIFSFRAKDRSVSSPAPYDFKPREIFRYRQFWGFLFCRFFGDVIWMFMIFWLPNYLSEARNFSIKEIALFAWIPFLGADIGNLLGGGASSFLVGRGWTINRARKTVMLTLGTIVILMIISVNRATTAAGCIALISFAAFAFQGWTANNFTLPADMFPYHVVASATGVGVFVSGVGTLCWNWYVGIVTDKFHSYALVFGAAGVLMALAMIMLILVMGRIEPVASQHVGIETH